MRNRAELHVGRLLEVRAEAGYRTQADVREIFAEITREAAKTPAPRLVIIVDWRRCPIMSEEAADVFVGAMKQFNGRIERTAALASKQAPTSVLQFSRLIRAADNPDRRLFEDPKDAVAWLAERLTDEEKKRLEKFVFG